MGMNDSLLRAKLEGLMKDYEIENIFTEQMEGVSEERNKRTVVWDDVGCMHTENNPNQNYLQLRNKRGKGKK